MAAKKIINAVTVICLLFLWACGPKAVAPQAVMDTPAHHVANGNKFLESGRLDDAFAAFTRAAQLDPRYSPAYVGLGLVYGKRGDFDRAFENMDRAKKFAEADAEMADVHVGYIRILTMAGKSADDQWLKKAEQHFAKAKELAPDEAAPYFYMGIAYKNACRFMDAATMFRRVLDMDKGFIGKADREYAIVQRIQRAMPGTAMGKKIALLPSITRADAAALFIEELKIDELFARKNPKVFDTSFKAPGSSFKTGEYVSAPVVTDIGNHVLKQDIEAVINLQVKGLQPGPDHRFEPDKVITRAEFAMMVEDILIKITGDDSLATKFIGSRSPFPDLRNDLPYFNAVMVCVTRNIMETADSSTGEFRPLAPVSGADALLAIRQLKIQLGKN